jgi:hypothetical protein
MFGKKSGLGRADIRKKILEKSKWRYMLRMYRHFFVTNFSINSEAKHQCQSRAWQGCQSRSLPHPLLASLGEQPYQLHLEFA